MNPAKFCVCVYKLRGFANMFVCTHTHIYIVTHKDTEIIARSFTDTSILTLSSVFYVYDLFKTKFEKNKTLFGGWKLIFLFCLIPHSEVSK